MDIPQMLFHKKENRTSPYMQYKFEDVCTLLGKDRKIGIGEKSAFHDVSGKKWRLTIQLDEKRKGMLLLTYLFDCDKISYIRYFGLR